ncbi:MAG: AAA family ATPase [Methylococcales bacterium]
MKILNIHFKNINSLAGESRIDFQQAPFSDTGVFAITGPNGSGKSSILDAITLGLYGETFRFDRPAAYVMTKQTAECFAEVEFSVGQEQYRSSWQVQREQGNPEGELMPAKMQLLRLGETQELLANNVAQVCAQITEITGMNFRNFTRAILLAQGDFAAFLNALDSERMDILEKIISTDIYADYKSEVADKSAKAEQRLQELTQDLAVVQVLEPEQQEAYEHDLLDFNEQYQELQQELERLKQQQNTLQGISTLQERLLEQDKKLKSSNAKAAEQQQVLAKIAAGQDVQLFKESMEELNLKSAGLQQNQAALTALQAELQELKQRLGNNPNKPDGLEKLSITAQMQAIDSMKAQMNLLNSQRNSETSLLQALAIQVTEKRSVLATVTDWLDGHAKEAFLVDDFPEIPKLRKLRAELLELEQQQNADTKWSKTTLATLKNNKLAIERELKQHGEFKKNLLNQEQDLQKLAQGRSLQDIEELGLELLERTKSFEEMHKLALANQKLDKSQIGFWSSLFAKKTVEFSSAELAIELEKLKLDVKREDNIKLALEHLLSQESLMKKMAADRHHLSDGKPCPLCGALQHPYAQTAPVSGSSKQAFTDQQAKLKAMLATVERLTKQLDIAQKREQKNHAEQNQLIVIRSQWLTLCNRLGVGSNLDITNTRLMKQLWDKQSNELKEVIGLLSKHKSKQADIEKLKAAIVKSENTVQQLQQAITELDAQWQARPKDTNYDALIAAKQLQEKQLTEKIASQLTALAEKMPPKKKEDALLDRLNTRRQEYQSYALRGKSLTEELDVLAAKELRCQTEIKNCNTKLDQLGSQLQTEEFAGLHLAVIEKQKLIIDKEQLVAQQQAELNRTRQAIQQRIQESAFSSIEEVSELLELMQNEASIAQQQAELVLQADAYNKELLAINEQLQDARAQLIPGLTEQDLGLKQKQVLEQMDIAKLEAQRLQRLLKDQQLLQQKYEVVLVQLQNQQEIVQECLAELDKISAESGNEFRRRVRNRIAEQLLSQTNAVLEKISGRYYLRQKTSEQGLALEIEDTAQNNARRLPKTLSGGESFVVSLALALGLAELANNGKSVDSLFLDEGFGNLDAETLYTVISTLENLHTQQGKIVGVISHIDSVQKRFKAQLQVVKKPNGMGELKKAS